MGEEILTKIEDRVLSLLNEAENLEAEDSRKKVIINEALAWTDKLTAIQHDNFDYFDKEDRRNIEREKIEANVKLEESKQKVIWQRVAFELTKALAPVIATMIGYNVFQKRLMKYEETGRVCSTAGRELHLPRFTK